jgi:tellurite resistance protein
MYFAGTKRETVMHDQDMAIIRALVPVAWADGVFEQREKETLDALLDAFGATDAEKAEVRAFAAEKKGIEDINLQDLSADDRRVLLQHAVLLSYADGDQSKEELDFLHKLADALKIPADESKALLEAAGARAKKYLNLLG